MLDISTEMMISEKKREDVARLLLIISDGRGVFSEGLERVKASVRRATDLGIFLVFVIIDNPKSKVGFHLNANLRFTHILLLHL